MKNELSQAQKISRIISLAIGVLGISLLIFMITVEDEPGALPLLLILIGAVWFSINQYRIKKRIN